MEFLLVVFKVRSQTLMFSNLLKTYRVPHTIINTPRSVNVSCGISVKVSPVDKQIIQDLLNRKKMDSFAGIFLMKQIGNNIIKA